MTGLPSVDMKSIGAGGGSDRVVDGHGMLHVGPKSAGAVPGPACYGQGGMRPTVTDAALVLGYIDPSFFLGGSMRLDRKPPRPRSRGTSRSPLGLTLDEAAARDRGAGHREHGAGDPGHHRQPGHRPREAVLVGGGGGGRAQIVAIGRRLGAAPS